MNDWMRGYHADNGYTYGYYPETSPVMLSWAALLQGHQMPSAKFRYLDAGCGQGLNLILSAAAHPESEFVGIDFSPEHVAHASELAAACGLKNVQFYEADFVDLAKAPLTFGQFDYAACHGITTWVSPTVKEALFSFIGKALRPSGLFYNSYNTLPGQLPTVPFQHLVLLEQRSKTGDLALKATQATFEQLQNLKVPIFEALPKLTKRLSGLKEQDPVYLVHEYSNASWQPVFVSAMMDDLARVKLSYLGTATLPEIFDASYGEAISKLLKEQASIELREQIRDFAVNQSFRRDVYVKGRSKPWTVAYQEALRGFRLACNPLMELPKSGEAYKFKAGALEIKGDYKLYTAVIEHFQKHETGATVGELLKDPQWKRALPETLKVVTYLLNSGWLLPMNSQADTSAGKSCNAALAHAVCAGAPYRHLSLPRAARAVNVSDNEWIILSAAIDKLPQEHWAKHVMDKMDRLNRVLSKNGKPIESREEKLKIIQENIDGFVKNRLGFYSRMGAL
jgi:SAM-dependent methyltransferase